MQAFEYHKFSGAGNTFVVIDGRGVPHSEYPGIDGIVALCREYGTDGLMILDNSEEADFDMAFFNPDGSGGMMCGNGGRCIVAFAEWLRVKPSAPGHYVFKAPDGIHEADILSHDGFDRWTVRLSMRDVHGVEDVLRGRFLDTGTRHFVRFVGNVETVDIEREALPIRHHEHFAPQGTNVNFVSEAADGLHVRTFEKGVEGETLACGTGITASAIAAWKAGIQPDSFVDGRARYHLKARTSWLIVDFIPEGDQAFRDIHLTGPAEMLF